MNRPEIRLIVGDASPIVLSGIQTIFSSDPRVTVTSMHLSLDGVRKAVAQERPSLVLLDWNLVAWRDVVSTDAFDWLLKYCPFAFLTMAESFGDQNRALHIGAKGIISKRISAFELRKAIREIARGAVWGTPLALFSTRSSPATIYMSFDQEVQRIRKITPRERHVIFMICKGKRNKQIAAELHISESTVSHHLTSLFAKLAVSDRLELLAFAYRHSNEFGFLGEVPMKVLPIGIPVNHSAGLPTS